MVVTKFGHALELRLVLCSRLVVQMPEVADEKFVGLELRDNVEEDTFGIRFVVGINVDVEPLAPVAHVLTVMAQRVDNLLARDEPGEADLGDRGLRTFAL